MRERLALASPGVFAFLFMLLLARRSLVDALPGAAVAAIGVLAMFYVGMIATTLFASWLGGTRADSRDHLRQYLAGVLLATFVWLWWQYDRDRTVTHIARCVQRQADYFGETRSEIGQRLVWACYDARGEDLIWEGE